jgi:hypothetical protein
VVFVSVLDAVVLSFPALICWLRFSSARNKCQFHLFGVKCIFYALGRKIQLPARQLSTSGIKKNIYIHIYIYT